MRLVHVAIIATSVLLLLGILQAVVIAAPPTMTTDPNGPVEVSISTNGPSTGAEQWTVTLSGEPQDRFTVFSKIPYHEVSKARSVGAVELEQRFLWTVDGDHWFDWDHVSHAHRSHDAHFHETRQETRWTFPFSHRTGYTHDTGEPIVIMVEWSWTLIKKDATADVDFEIVLGPIETWVEGSNGGLLCKSHGCAYATLAGGAFLFIGTVTYWRRSLRTATSPPT